MPHTILCIDGKPEALEVWKTALEGAGYRVLATTSGNQGIDIFQQGGVDLVVVDLKSRDTHGAEVARQLRKLSPRLPVIMLCGSYWWPPEAALEFVSALVIKGDGAQAIVDKVQELLAAQATAPEQP
ncbi:MAG TPA: response regulator [Terriglobales bacterium]|nr:response regulator [Terriglobales bacterium]